MPLLFFRERFYASLILSRCLFYMANSLFTGCSHTIIARRCIYLKVVIYFHIYHFCESAVDICSAPLFRGGTTFAYFTPFLETPGCRYGRAAHWGCTTLPSIIPVDVSI